MITTLRSVLRKTVPEVLDTSRVRRPRVVLKTKGTVFRNADRPRLVNNIFIFFYNATKGMRKTRTFSSKRIKSSEGKYSPKRLD